MPIKDPDALRAYRKAQYAANRDTILARNKTWRAANPERNAELVAKWHAENPDRVREIKRKHAETHDRPYVSRGPIRNRLAHEKHKAAHPEYVRVANQRRRSGVAERTPSWDAELDALVFREAARLAVSREKVTGFKWEIDHTLPLKGKAVSGLHVWNNLQVVPKAYNRAKSNNFSPQPQGN